MAIDPSTITWDTPPQQQAGVSASPPQIDPNAVTWDEPKQSSANDFTPIIQAAAAKYQLDPRLLTSQIKAESNFNPRAKSQAGAEGLMQLMPATAADLGVTDPYDPAQSIEAGAKYMRQMLDQNGNNHELALAAYNWGPGNLSKNGIKNAPKETRDYIAKIKAGAGDPDVPYPGVAGDQATPPVATTDDFGTRRIPQNDLERSIMQGSNAASNFQQGFLNDVNDATTQGLSAIIPDSVERALSTDDLTGAERVAKKEAGYQQRRAEVGNEGIDLARIAGNVVSPPNMALGVTGALEKLPAWFLKMPAKAQAALSAVARGGLAGILQPTDTKPGESFAADKAAQAGLGAVAGPIAEGAGKLITGVVGKGIGAVTNQLKPEAKRVMDLAAEQGVPVTAGQVTPGNKILTGVEGTMENVRMPGLSLVPAREASQQAAKKTAQKLVDEEYSKLQSTAYMGLDRIQKLAQEDGVRSGEARKIMDMVSNAGEDEKAIMQASGNMTWLRKKISSDKNYAARDALAGDAQIAPTNTMAALDSAIERLPNEVDFDPAAISQLQKWKGQFGGGEAEVDPIQAAVHSMDGTTPAVPEAPANTLARMSKFKTSLETRIQSATQSGMTPSTKLYLTEVAKGVGKDINAFVEQNPKLKEATQVADDFYKRHVVPYHEDRLAKALTAETPENIYSAFIRQQSEGKGDYAAKLFFKALDSKGQQAVRYGIAKQAMDNAMDSNGKFSATKFNDTFNKTAYSTFFKGSDALRVRKVVDLFDHLSRTTPEHLMTYSPVFGGNFGMAPAMIGAGAMYNPSAAILAYGGGTFMRWLMTSDAGKRALFSTNVFSKGSSKEAAGAALDRIARQFNASTATAAGAESGHPGRVLP